MHLLELFTHAGCFSGIEASTFIQKVLRDFPDVSFREVDMFREPRKASEIGVQMSPTLVYNEKILFIGIPSEAHLRALLKSKTGME